MEVGLDGGQIDGVVFGAGMISHHGEAERSEKQGQQEVGRKLAFYPHTSRILKLDMSVTLVDSSYMQVSEAATVSEPSRNGDGGAKEKLALVIPTLREAENLPGLINRVRSALDPMETPYEILVVDDDSRDGTEQIVSAIARRDTRIRLLVRHGQKGLSGAVLDGWQATDAPILGVMDADLQHPPELLPALLSAIFAGKDMAIGSRYTAGGGLGNWNPVRKLISAAAGWVTWPIQRPGIRVKDPMSGFFLVRRACVDKIAFERAGFKLLLEILVRGRIRSVEEVPFEFGLRSQGASKASFKVAVDYARLLARLYRYRFGRRRD
jgi:dolichol-phosphate mannosyltransferase